MNDTTPKKQIVVRVCNEASCVERGAVGVIKKIEEEDADYDLVYCPCVGCCEFGPNLLVNNNLVLGAKKEIVIEQIKEAAGTIAPTSEEKIASLEKVLEDLI